MNFVVTIDGPAAAGKSTTARAVAARLGVLYLDTGALYRAFAFKVLERGISPEDLDGVEQATHGTTIDLTGEPDHPRVWLDGVDVSEAIRTPEVSEMSSRLAALPVVRRWLTSIQRAIAERGPLVAEGRDLGTVVFADADLKIYLDADPMTRALRRHRELQARGIAVARDEVAAEVERRDARDKGRADSPLKPAPDAIVIDTSPFDHDAQVDAVLAVVRAHPRCPAPRS